MTMTQSLRLAPEALYRRCDPGQLAFSTTAELEDLSQFPGQERARDAVAFGIDVARAGFNLFVMGPPGTGRHTLVREFLARRVVERPKPSDWAYVNNFREPYRPIAVELPAGRAAALRDDMRQLVEELRIAIPAVFDSDEYRARAGQIETEFGERHERAFNELGAEAAAQKIGLLRTPAGFSFAPLKDGEVISPEDYARLPEEEKARIERIIVELQKKLGDIIRNVVHWRREQREKLKQLNREMTLVAVGHHVAELKERYGKHEKVLDYLDAVQQNVIDNVDDFLPGREAPPMPGLPAPEPPSFRRYTVNVLVDHGGKDGTPVVMEDHPSYNNLIGRVDHISQFGTLATDFALIKSGALHRANGGYLLIDALKLLMQPFAWEALKRALSTRQIRIESIGEMYSLVSTVALAPEPIPLEVKVVLFGDRFIYYLLHAYDPDFRDLFKVVADFEDSFERTAENEGLFARLIGTIAREKKLLAVDRAGVARSIEHASRLAGDARKVSGSLRALADLLCEADHLARENGRSAVTGEDVERAIAAQRTRGDRLRTLVHEAILRGTILIDTGGARSGQVNGLSVMQLGDHAFAAPSRITATTRLGEGKVIDVQREVELGGAIHSKGVLILSAFLASRFSMKHPLSLAASLVFEQTYGLVEGDSASLAELVALLSSLADAPVRQAYAVTGSVNQLGEVQAIGAVNEKIEGYFDVCAARGLTGEHGVLIPSSNVEHLMLRADVVEAVAAGRFHVYAVRTVDEAIELLTGTPAGEPDAATGAFPAASVNGRVAKRLREFAAMKARSAREAAPARRRFEKRK
jgi:lon-related putative ATP-dependent protease